MSSLCSVSSDVKSVSLLDLADEGLVVLVEEAPDVAERLVQRAQRGVEVGELSASTCDTDATWLENCTICSLLFDSALTSTCRLRTVPNRSVRESPRRPAVCESSRSASADESPLPSKVRRPGHELAQRAAMEPCGPELGTQLGELLLDLVPLHGHAGSVEAHLGAVGHRRATGVRRVN